MLSSGCLGMLDGNDSSDSQPEASGLPPALSVNGNGPYLHDENVVVIGDFEDENPGTVSIQGSMANGAISRKASTSTNSFALEFGILPAGTHSVKITATDENGLSVVSVVSITVQTPPEDPVSISAFPPVLYVEGGESTIARAKIIHSALNTCSGTWEDELERFQTVAISGEYAVVSLAEVESSFNGTFVISCGSSEITTDSVSVYVFVFSEENPDLDGDGIPDDADRCVESSVAFTSSPANDIDGDGCHDISEDTDDDDDGRPDTSDRCARGLIGWDSSNTSLDHDSDGCQDLSEDDDDDDDTIVR